jgi:hypothetical protein
MVTKPKEELVPTKSRGRGRALETPSPDSSTAPESMLRVARGLSWIRFVYPFSFDAKEFDNRVKAINDGLVDGPMESEGSNDPTSVWTLVGWRQSKGDGRSEDVGADLLPHVARFLGEPDEGSRGYVPPRTAYMWSLKDEWLKHFLGEGDKVRWNLRLWRENIPFEVDEVQLALFRHGVGFLTLSAKPSEVSVREGSVATWLNFLYGFRFLRGKPYATVRAVRTDDIVRGEFRKSAPGLPPSWAEGSDIFSKVICPLLFTGAIEEPLWWQEVFVPGQLIPFVALFVDRKPKNGDVPEDELYDLLYRLRNVLSIRQQASMSSNDRRFDHPDLLPYADQMWFYFSLSAGGFLAYNAPTSGPFRSSLPKRYLKDEYFLAFLLTLQQRFVLGVITDKIAEHWLPSARTETNTKTNTKTNTNTETKRTGDRRWKIWRRWLIEQSNRTSSPDDSRSAQFDELLEAFLMFSARGHFVQLMQGEHHQLYYQKWQEKFQVKQLYEEVQNELNAMHDFLEMVVQERVNYILHVLTALSIILGVVGTIAGWWALNLDNISTSLSKWRWPIDLVWLSCLLIVPLVLLGVVMFARMGWFARRRHRS